MLNQRRLNEAYDDVSSGVGDDDEDHDSSGDQSEMDEEMNDETDNIE